MRRLRRTIAGTMAGAALLAAPLSAAAQQWRSEDGRAGFVADGRFDGLWLGCEGEGVRLVFAAPGWDLDEGAGYTVVANVDGTAFVFSTLAEANRTSGEDELVRHASFAELAGFVAALKAGRSAEISGPTGRYTLPLAGSGRALAELENRCGGR